MLLVNRGILKQAMILRLLRLEDVFCDRVPPLLYPGVIIQIRIRILILILILNLCIFQMPLEIRLHCLHLPSAIYLILARILMMVYVNSKKCMMLMMVLWDCLGMSLLDRRPPHRWSLIVRMMQKFLSLQIICNYLMLLWCMMVTSLLCWMTCLLLYQVLDHLMLIILRFLCRTLRTGLW